MWVLLFLFYDNVICHFRGLLLWSVSTHKMSIVKYVFGVCLFIFIWLVELCVSRHCLRCVTPVIYPTHWDWEEIAAILQATQIAKFMGPTWGPPGSCRPQMGPILAPWTLLSGDLFSRIHWFFSWWSTWQSVSIGSADCLAPSMRRAMTRINDDPLIWRIYASTGFIDLISTWSHKWLLCMSLTGPWWSCIVPPLYCAHPVAYSYI